MAILTDDAGETFGKVPCLRFNFGNDHADNGPRTRFYNTSQACRRYTRRLKNWIARESSLKCGNSIGYGFLTVTLINLCACFGLVFLSLQGLRYYDLFLSVMVAVAIGALVSSALIVLIPECLHFDLSHCSVRVEL
ncbi:unnamed protein product [Protopolystoma xenopodis]|uniref:Uncharacterized protein n=1 Tax=Protopolystoma xenopodis TaxID=117903 RepID=A0A448XBC7_9PLAT|nr:unnamed protein product [Protopolystoma xenopodis]